MTRPCITITPAHAILNPADGWLDMTNAPAPLDGTVVDIRYWDGSVAAAVRYIKAAQMPELPVPEDEFAILPVDGFRSRDTDVGALCVLGMTHWRPARMAMAA